MANEARQAEQGQCPRCHGSRIDPYPALERFANAPCKYCDGHGSIPASLPSPDERAAQRIASNRIAKAQRIARALAASWSHIGAACRAAQMPELTSADLADAIERAASNAGERFRFTVALFVSEEASQETWAIVVRIVREWAASDARVLAFEARR